MSKRVYKATRKLTSGPKEFRKWNDWEVGDVYIGKYVETYIDNYDKECFVFQTIDAQFKDKAEAKRFADKNFGANHNGMLAKAMAKAAVGDCVQIIYNGKSEIEKGKYAGKEAHTLDVDIVELEEDDATAGL